MDESRVKLVELEYPNVPESKHDTIEVDLIDVRAADSIRIRYDFERDGWAIFQCRSWMEDTGPKSRERKYEWKEVAFRPAWALGWED